jgi:hypothetical protein
LHHYPAGRLFPSTVHRSQRRGNGLRHGDGFLRRHRQLEHSHQRHTCHRFPVGGRRRQQSGRYGRFIGIPQRLQLGKQPGRLSVGFTGLRRFRGGRRTMGNTSRSVYGGSQQQNRYLYSHQRIRLRDLHGRGSLHRSRRHDHQRDLHRRRNAGLAHRIQRLYRFGPRPDCHEF